jgi:hypothetical protein
MNRLVTRLLPHGVAGRRGQRQRDLDAGHAASLVHVTAISLERVHVEPRLEDGRAVVKVRAGCGRRPRRHSTAAA